jgi:hypothetical protein
MSKLNFKALKYAFDNQDCSTNIDLIRQLLYDFSYKNLSDKDSNYEDNEVDNIRIGIFNFLYSGVFEEDINKDTISYFKDIIENHLIDKLQEVQESDKNDKENIVKGITEKLVNLPTWEEFYKQFENNWKGLILYHKDNYLNSLNGTIRHFVVYEAPPPCQKGENILDVYFLSSNSGSYATIIKNTFNAFNKDQVCQFMADKNIGYFDLIMAPMPISSDIRKNWSTQSCWQIGGKQLPVILFELGIAHLILEGKEIENPTFAIGTPALTSTSIFEHYSDKLLKVWKRNGESSQVCDILFEEPNIMNKEDFELLFTSNLSITNSQTTHKIRGEEGRGIIFPLFKSNVISGSNYLSELLMKNAFDLC